MSAICQATVLDSPLQEWVITESVNTWNTGKRPRNARVSRYVKELQALNGVSHIPEKCSYFCQNLQSVPFSSYDFKIPSNIVEELHSFLSKTVPLVSSKVTASSWKNHSKKDLSEKIQSIHSHEYFRTLEYMYYWKIWYENLVVASARPDSSVRTFSPPEFTVQQFEQNGVFVWGSTSETGLNIDTSRGLTHIYQGNCHWVVTREHLLMLSDSASQRFICLLSSILGEILDDTSLPYPELLLSVFHWGDSILERLHNDGYRSLKFWEPLITGKILQYNFDPHVEVDPYVEGVRNDFVQSVPDQSEFLNLKLLDLDEILNQARNQGGLSTLTQLFGLYRMWGHPTVNGLLGVMKLRQVTQQNRSLNLIAIKSITCKWREYFTTSYYNKHGHLPEFKKLPDTGYIKDCLERRELPSQVHPNYLLQDWSHVRFAENFLIPERFDFSDLIADKATSFGYQKLKERCKKFGDIGPGSDRSVIIRWLQEEFISPIDFLTNISQNGFPLDEIVAGVFPKEREGKNEPRLFGIMTLVKRLYIVLTEALLSEFILPLFPEITMTFDAVTLANRVFSCTKKLFETNPIGKEQGTPIVTNLDFMKWNSYMRREETEEIFQDFDDLFGLTSVFTRTHEVFNPCFFYLADGSITPEFDENGMKVTPGVWTDHLGGVEGLRQKGWTIFTVVILRTVSDKLNIKCQLMGQGDNQVLINTYFPRPGISIKDQHLGFMSSLNGLLSCIGPPLKMEESWTSSKFFVYGKAPVYEGIPLPMSLKKTCRMHRLNNDGVLNLDGTLSSIAANCSAAVSMSNNPIIPFFLAIFESMGAFELFLRRPFYGGPLLHEHLTHSVMRVPDRGISILHRRPLSPNITNLLTRSKFNELFQIFCCFPSALGGYPVIQWSDVIMRGFPDPVTAALWELKLLLSSSIPLTLRDAILRMMNPPLNPSINPELLCQDPTGLNLLKGSRPKDKVKHFVVEFLTTMPGIRNQEFLEFLRLATEDQEPLATALFDVTPCHPRVMSEVYNATPQGRAAQCIRKIDKTPVLLNLMCKNHDKARHVMMQEIFEEDEWNEERRIKTPKLLVKTFHSFEINQLSGLLCTLSCVPLPAREQRCSCSLAAELRSESWGKELCGVSVAFPHELLAEGKMMNYQIGGQILIRVEPPMKSIDYMLNSLGPFSPYLGSSSKEKVEYQGKKLVSVSPSFMTNALRSLRFVNWGTDERSLFTDLIFRIFAQFTDADPLKLIPKTGMVTGTLEHRVSDMRTSHSGTLSIPYTYSTHVSVNTNQFKPGNLPHMSNHNNYNISFQSIFSYLAGEMFLNMILEKKSPAVRKLIIRCQECVRGVNEESLELRHYDHYEQAIQSKALNTRSDFMWVSKDHLEELLERKRDPSRTKTVLKSENRSITPLEPKFQNKEAQIMLSLVLIHDLMTQHPLTQGSQFDWIYDEERYILPVSMVPNLDVIKFFDHMCMFFIIKSIYVRSKFWANSSKVNGHIIYLVEQSKLSNSFPRGWVSPLSSLFLCDEVFLAIRTSYPGVNPPLGSPPSPQEKTKCLHKILTYTFARRLDVIKCSELIEELLKMNLPLSRSPVFHPQVLRVLLLFLRSESESEQRLYLLILGKLRVLEGINKGLPNTLDLTEELGGTETKGVFDGIETEHLIDLKGMNPPVQTTADWISKTIGEMTNLPRGLPQGDIQNNPFMISLHGLPESSTVILLRMTLQNSSDWIPVENRALELHPSPLNSLFKEPVLVTSAPLKLLSIFSILTDSEKHFIPKIKKVLCSGDGAGGFSALMGHLSPRAKIIYNTLYDPSRLSSVGIDRYVPAAFVVSGLDESRILGIREIEEGVSDLTDNCIIEQHRKLCQDKLDMIICDAEGSSSRTSEKPLKITKNLVKLAFLTQSKIMIIKSYATRIDVIMIQICLLLSLYETVRIVRSCFSGIGNSEVYIIGARIRVTGPGKVEWKSVSGDKLLVRGNVLNKSEQHSVLSRFTSNLDFHYDCEDLIKPYLSKLRKVFPSAIDPSLEVFLLSCSYQGMSSYRMYPEVMDSLRSIFTPAKFSEGTKIRTTLYLTVPIIKDLSRYFLGIIMSTLPKEMLRNPFELFQSINLVIYENQKGSWSLALRKELHLAFNYKSWLLSDLLEDQLFCKSLYSVARQVIRFHQDHKIAVIPQIRATCSSVETNFPLDSPYWFTRMGQESCLLSEMPALAPGQHFIKPSSFKEEDLKVLTPDLITHLGKDLVKHKKVSDLFPYSGLYLGKWRERNDRERWFREHKRVGIWVDSSKIIPKELKEESPGESNNEETRACNPNYFDQVD